MSKENRHRTLGIVTPSLRGVERSDFVTSFRNFSRHELRSDGKVSNVCARPSTTLPPSVALSAPVSSTLLNEMLAESRDGNLQTLVPRFQRSMAACSHGDTACVVHVSGKFMDDLLIRRVSLTESNTGERNAVKARTEAKEIRTGRGTGAGFHALSLAKGQAVLDIQSLGEARFGSSCSQLLARTRFELFQLQTVSPGDSGGFPSSFWGGTPGEIEHQVLLDPLQKWQFPQEILASAVCSGTQYQSGVVLCQSGGQNEVDNDECTLYSWNPSDGPLRHRVVPGGRAKRHGYCNSVEMSLHPQVCYVTQGNHLNVVDFRTALSTKQLLSHQLFSTAYAAPESSDLMRQQSDIASVCQHATQSQYMLIGTQNQFTQNRRSDASVFLFDTRYPKASVSQRFVPHAHTSMSFFGDTGIGAHAHDSVLGYSPGTTNLYVHSLRVGAVADVPDPFDLSEHSNSHPEAANSIFVSSISLPFGGVDSSIRWNTNGFTVVDAVSPDVTTAGATLVPISQRSTDKGSADTVGQQGHERGRRCSALYHQNSLGDVYMQRLYQSHEGLSQIGDMSGQRNGGIDKDRVRRRKGGSDTTNKRSTDEDVIPSAKKRIQSQPNNPFVFSADNAHTGAIPLSSDVFVQNIQVNTVAQRFSDKVHVRPGNMSLNNILSGKQTFNSSPDDSTSADANTVPAKCTVDLSVSLGQRMRDKHVDVLLLSRLALHPMSLWELWIESSHTLQEQVDVNELRRFLVARNVGISDSEHESDGDDDDDGLGLVELDLSGTVLSTMKSLSDGYCMRTNATDTLDTEFEINTPQSNGLCGCTNLSISEHAVASDLSSMLCGLTECTRVHQLVYSQPQSQDDLAINLTATSGYTDIRTRALDQLHKAW